MIIFVTTRISGLMAPADNEQSAIVFCSQRHSPASL